jgi:uncharacterized membrane protein
MRFQLYRSFGHFLFFASIWRLLFVDNDLPLKALPFLNVRLLDCALVFCALAVAAYMYRRNKTIVGKDEQSLFALLAVECAFIGLAGLSFEIQDFFAKTWYPILWAAGGLIAGWLSFKIDSLALRCVTYLTFVAAICHLLIIDTVIVVVQYIPLFNARLLAFVISAAIIETFIYLFNQNKNKITIDEYALSPVLFCSFHLLLIWAISAEIISICDQQSLLNFKSQISSINFENVKNVLLSISWTVYSIVLLVIGIFKKSTYNRFLSIALFCVVIFKVFLIDTSNLDNLSRFYSFITLGFILLLAGYLYYRYQNRILKFVKDGG